MHHSPLDDVLILLALSVVAVALVRRVSLPPILGYLFVGVIAGQHALGWIPHGEAIHLMGEIGVVFLLFMIGLEISIPQLISMRGAVLGLGGAQMLISTLSGFAILLWVGIPWQAGVILAGTMALSSTAIVAKQLTEQLEIKSRHGRNALGILLFQDIAVVPFLVAIPILASGNDAELGSAMGIALAKGVGIVIVMLLLGRFVLRPLLSAVARAQSVELFTLAILLVTLTAAWLTNAVGLSLALGAFIAGMMVGDTEYRHHVELEVRPFRDVLMGLFFITVGTQLDVASIPQNAIWIALLVVGIIVGKGLLIAVLTKLSGGENGVSLRTGMVLAQGGEFGFALLALALTNGLVRPEDSQPVLAAVVISMAIAPLLVRYNGQIVKRLSPGYQRERESRAEDIEQEARSLDHHVILCGFGRVGQNLSLFLKAERIGYIGLDVDPSLIAAAHQAGEPVYFADATHHEILEAAGIKRADAVVIALRDSTLAERIVKVARKLRPDVPIIARCLDDAYIELLERAGATEVVPESVEASLNLATRLLRRLDIDIIEIQSVIEQARTDQYRRLRSFFHSEEADAEEIIDDHGHLYLQTIVVQDNDWAVGRRIGELELADINVGVPTLRRAGLCNEQPGNDMVIRSGDALVIEGHHDQVARAGRRLTLGPRRLRTTGADQA